MAQARRRERIGVTGSRSVLPSKASSRVRASAEERAGLSVTSSSQRLLVMVAEAEHQFMERVEPLAARCRTTNEEIWRMFESVLSSQKTKRTRRAVRDVFHALIRHGVLDPVEAEVGAEFEDHGEPDAAESGARAHPGPGLGGHSAAPRGAEPGRDSLKAVFKRLTLAFHPDRTQDAAEKLA